MKTLLIIPFLFLFQKSNMTCDDFHTGTFDLPSVDGSVHRIIRTEKLQKEFVGKTGLESECSVKWVNECSYVIFNRKVLKGNDEYPEFNKDTLVCKIENINGSTFTVSTTFKGQRVDAVMKKIK